MHGLKLYQLIIHSEVHSGQKYNPFSWGLKYVGTPASATSQTLVVVMVLAYEKHLNQIASGMEMI